MQCPINPPVKTIGKVHIAYININVENILSEHQTWDTIRTMCNAQWRLIVKVGAQYQYLHNKDAKD